MIWLLAAFAASLSVSPSRPSHVVPEPLHGIHRVLFLGDSITYAGEYVDIVQTWLAIHEPASEIKIYDLGLPSETVSGLSEPGHAGGAFPRPELRERLDRTLAAIKPNLVFACYGMNDGIYYPLGDDRFEKYKTGIRELQAKCKQSGARLILMTPPPFDSEPIRASTLPAGLSAYPQPYVGYDDVLAAYAKWLLTLRREGQQVIDLHTPLRSYLDQARLTDKAFRFAGDGVHMNSLGHYIAAREILNVLGAHRVTQTVVATLAADKLAAKTDEHSSDNLSIDVQVRPLMPLDSSLGLAPADLAIEVAKYDRLILKFPHARADRKYRLDLPNGPLTVSGVSLAAGIDLTPYASTLLPQAKEIASAVHTIRSTLRTVALISAPL